MKYTYSDDEDLFSDGVSTRKSTRNISDTSTPAEPAAPRFTASGRQVRTRAGGQLYGQSLLAGGEESEDAGRPQRTRTSTRANGYTDFSTIDDMGDDSEAASNSSSGNEWQGDDEEDEQEIEVDEEEEVSGDDSVVDDEPQSLMVQLKYDKHRPYGRNGAGEESSGKRPEVAVLINNHPASVPQQGLAPTQQPMSQLDGSQDIKPQATPETTAPSFVPAHVPAETQSSGLSNGANGLPSMQPSGQGSGAGTGHESTTNHPAPFDGEMKTG